MMIDYAALNERLRNIETHLERLEHLEPSFYHLEIGTGTTGSPAFGNLYVMNDALIGRNLDVTATGSFATVHVQGGDLILWDNQQFTCWGVDAGPSTGTAGVQYRDSGNNQRAALFFPGDDLVVVGNRASNGTVQIRANNNTAGSGGEDVVAQFEADDDPEQNAQITYGREIQQAGSTTATGNHGVIRQIFLRAVVDNVNTGIFSVRTDDATNDAGHYHCSVDVVAMNNAGATGPVGTSGDTATAHERFEWVRAQENGGTGVNSALATEHGTPLDAATASATRDISTITGNLSESSEFDIRFQVAVNGTGTSPTPLYVLAIVELQWAGFEVAPWIEAL